MKSIVNNVFSWNICLSWIIKNLRTLLDTSLITSLLKSHVDGLNFMGYQFSWFSWRVRSTNFSTQEMIFFCMTYEKKMLWPRILNLTNVSFLFNPRKLVPTKNITTQSIASPRTPHLSMITIVTLTFELWSPKSIGFTMVNMSAKFYEEAHNGLVCIRFTAYFYMCPLWPWPLTSDLQNQ